MMPDDVTFADLRRVLQGLGFTETVVPGSHIVFDHATTGTQIVVPPYRDKDLVHPRHLAVARRYLDENGLVRRDAFEALWRKVSA
jgi:predicted RNA binding protein YcfA (HicA-like mRNA interferase family)